MKRTIRTAAVFALASLCLCAGAGAKIVAFQIPGAKKVWPVSINDKDQVAGYFSDAAGEHGFLRQPDGTLATFDVPGAQNTVPAGISAAGVITGSYYPPKHGAGGFVRAADGTITTFTVPGGPFTEDLGANSKGWSVGDYARNVHAELQAFFRSPSGATTEFSVPEAMGTRAVAINRSRTIAGVAIINGQQDVKGFVRSPHGDITLFGDPYGYVQVAGINDDGTVTGWASIEEPEAAFVRTSDGTFTAFTGPNGTIATEPWAINNAGTVVGEYLDTNGVFHGFLRTAGGTLAPFDPEGSIHTEIFAINNKGAIAGTYTNQDNLNLGFVGKP